MASTYSIVCGSLIGALVWLFLAIRIPCVPIGRTLATLAGSILMIIFGMLSSSQAFDAISVNIEVIALLFGSMIISVLLEREHMFEQLSALLLYRCHNAFTLMWRLSLLSAVLSLLITNDSVCLFLTSFVIELCKRHNVPLGPALINLAASANIGSACTPVGNPQNIVIATLSGISYATFFKYIAPAVLCSLLLNYACLCLWYRRELSNIRIIHTNAAFVRMSVESDTSGCISTSSEGHVHKKEAVEGDREETGPIQSGAGLVSGSHLAVNIPTDVIEKDASVLNKLNFTSRQQVNNNALHPLQLAYHTPRTEDTVTRSISEPSLPIFEENGALLLCEIQLDYWHQRKAEGDLFPLSAQQNKQLDDLLQMNEGNSYTNETTSSEVSKQKPRLVLLPTLPSRHDIRLLQQSRKDRKESVNDARGQRWRSALAWRHILPPVVMRSFSLVPVPNKLLIFFLIFLGVIGAFACGLNLGWSAVGGAVVMMIVDWRAPDATISMIDWSILVFFSSLFVVTAGFSSTSLPNDVFQALQNYFDVTRPRDLVIFSLFILIGSNTVSNVPLVLLFGPYIPSLASPASAWLLLAFVSTIAGNLTLVGSVANLIVANKAKNSYHLGFYEYSIFGFPTTILITALGVVIIALQT